MKAGAPPIVESARPPFLLDLPPLPATMNPSTKTDPA